jgi:hypothetical protein
MCQRRTPSVAERIEVVDADDYIVKIWPRAGGHEPFEWHAIEFVAKYPDIRDRFEEVELGSDGRWLRWPTGEELPPSRRVSDAYKKAHGQDESYYPYMPSDVERPPQNIVRFASHRLDSYDGDEFGDPVRDDTSASDDSSPGDSTEPRIRDATDDAAEAPSRDEATSSDAPGPDESTKRRIRDAIGDELTDEFIQQSSGESSCGAYTIYEAWPAFVVDEPIMGPTKQSVRRFVYKALGRQLQRVVRLEDGRTLCVWSTADSEDCPPMRMYLERDRGLGGETERAWKPLESSVEIALEADRIDGSEVEESEAWSDLLGRTAMQIEVATDHLRFVCGHPDTHEAFQNWVGLRLEVADEGFDWTIDREPPRSVCQAIPMRVEWDDG